MTRTHTTYGSRGRADAEAFMRMLLILRVGVCTLALGGTGLLLLRGEGPDAWIRVGALLVASYIVSGLYWTAFTQGYRSRFQAYGPIFIDIVVNTWIVHYSGGLESPFALLYLLTILTVGAVFQTRTALVAATVSALCFGGLGWLEFARIVPPAVSPGLNVAARQDVAYAFFYVVLQMGFFYATAMGAGALSRRLQEEGEALASTADELRKARLDTASILQHMPSGVVSADTDGTILLINQAGSNMLGIDRSGAIGQPLTDVFGNGREAFRGVIERALATRSAAPRVEIAVRRPDGRELPLGVSVSILKETDGGPRGAIAVFQDLTEVQRMRSAVRRADRLAAVGELSTAIAHELRNPLASIGGAIELLQADLELSGEHARLMNLILKESRRLKRITGEFLDFASVREKRIRRVDLREVFREVACLFRGYERFTGRVDLRLSIEPGLVWTDVDEEQLKQVLLNLGYNALDAIDGSGQIRLEARTCGPAAGQSAGGARGLEIVVEDNGCGIPPGEQERVFQPFYSLKAKGTGLGLSIVSKIVEDHGGSVSMESEVGRGTRMCVVLPACVPAEAGAPDAEALAGVS